MMDAQILAAVQLYRARCEGQQLPTGALKGDGRWAPDDAERAPCCTRVCYPYRLRPSGTFRHCFTIPHIAERFEVDEDEMRMVLTNMREKEVRDAKRDKMYTY